MIERFLDKVEFSSYADFMHNFKVNVPDDFNFGYDIVDVYAETEPDKEAITWVNDQGVVQHVTYRALKNNSDRCASFLQEIGVERGDRVMLVLKRRLEWWYTMVALHKIGAVAIPATHMLTDRDIVYRCYMAGISCIISTGDADVLGHVQKARRQAPTLRSCISIGPTVPNGWYDYWRGLEEAASFVPPQRNKVTDNFMLLFHLRHHGRTKDGNARLLLPPCPHHHCMLLAPPRQ